jgi:hypothetical protein
MQKPNQMVAPGAPGGPPAVPYVRDQVAALEVRVAALEAKVGITPPSAAAANKQ